MQIVKCKFIKSSTRNLYSPRFRVSAFQFLDLNVRVVRVLIIAVSTFGFSAFAQETQKAVYPTAEKTSTAATVPTVAAVSAIAEPTAPESQTRESLRLKLYLDEVRTIILEDKIQSAIVLTPVIVKANIVGERSLEITCITLGETTIIANVAGKYVTIVVEAVSHPSQSPREFEYLSRRSQSKTFGVYSIGVSPPSNFSPTYFRHTLSLRRSVSPTKTFRADVDFYNPLGKSGSQLFSTFDQRFSLNRIELGMTEKNYSVDVLDSTVNLSRADLDNYLVRGFHYQRRDESAFGKTRYTVEVFAGLARPATTFFSRREGGLFGAALPVLRNKKMMLRAGFVTVIPSRRNGKMNVGTAFRIDGKYEQSDDDKYEFGLDYDTKKLSFFGKTDNKIKDFTINTETTSVADTSPFVRIGAQSSARKSINASVYWQPKLPIFAFVSYNKTKASAFAFSRQNNSFDLGFFISSINYAPTPRTRLNFSYVTQDFNAKSSVLTNAQTNGNSLPALISTFTKTRSFAFTYSQSFGRGFTNEFSIRPTFSRDPRSKAELNKGLILQEEIRRSFSRFSVSAFANLTRQTPSVESIIIGSPSLLPPDLRQEFDRNPAQFFIVYRDLLRSYIGNSPLPFTRSSEAGIRTQGSFTKNTFSGEFRVINGDIFGQKRSNLLASGGYVYRLDDANLIGVNGSRLFSGTSGISGASSVTLTYTYRFGGQNEKSFNLLKALGLKKLFGSGKGEIAGRVFTDANNNGRDDENETGVPNIKVVLDDGELSAITDANGDYNFKEVSTGSHKVAVKLNELGIKIRASTQEEQTVIVGKRKQTKTSFGLNDKGFISGRVFNGHESDGIGANSTGLPNVRLNLYKIDASGNAANQNIQSKTTDSGGKYEFPSLEPNKYILEIDSATLPPNFRLPEKSRFEITVEPLRGNYFSVPIAAQRAIIGTVFTNKNGDETFDPTKSEMLEGVRVVAQIINPNSDKPFTIEVVSGKNGAYILRNLPAGLCEVQAFTSDNRISPKSIVQLTVEPTTQRNINLAVPKRKTVFLGKDIKE